METSKLTKMNNFVKDVFKLNGRVADIFNEHMSLYPLTIIDVKEILCLIYEERECLTMSEANLIFRRNGISFNDPAFDPNGMELSEANWYWDTNKRCFVSY